MGKSRSTASSTRKEPMSVQEVLTVPFPEREWVIPDLIPIGLTGLVARSKIGKSWLMLSAAVAFCLKNALPLGPYRTEPGNVLYFDLEMMPWQNRRRLEQLISHYETSQGERIQGLSDHTIYFFDPSSMPFRCLDDKGIEAFEAEIVKHDANLVVVDTIARVFPPTLRGSNAYFAEYDFYGKLQGVAQRTESAVVLLHHENKGTKEGADPMDRASGTAAFAATVDAYLLLDRKRSVDGTPSYEGKLFCTGRLVQQRTIEVEWKDSRGFTVTSDPLLERRAKRYGEQTQLPEVVI